MDEDLRRVGEGGRVVGGVEGAVVVDREDDGDVVREEGGLVGEVEASRGRFEKGWS